MSSGKYAIRDDRRVVAVSGSDAHTFLQGMVTANIDRVSETGSGFGALLSPQGKILFDFLVTWDGERFLFDLPAASAADFAKRLTFYKLRAKVEIADLTGRIAVAVIWDYAEPPAIGAVVRADPRVAALGFRAYLPDPETLAETGLAGSDAEVWHCLRIELGVPEAGYDFTFGDVFPHEVNMDDLNGLDFKKGCYVGQEVVSRMQHRGTVRKRFVKVSAAGKLPAIAADITAADKPIGRLGDSRDGNGLALVRLDRAKAAMDAGIPIMALDIPLTLGIPDYAHFTWPETTDQTEAE